MNGIIAIGPLMIATDRALTLLAIMAFLALGKLIASRTRSEAGKVAWLATLVGLLAARASFIAENWAAFRVEPWTMLAFWQGGFSPGVGAIAAALTIVWRLGRQPPANHLLVALAGVSAAYIGLGAATAPEPWPFPREISVATMDGRAIALDDLRGRPFIINLWATWCPPCRREMPMMIDVAKGSTVPVLLVNQGETDRVVAHYLDKYGLAGDAIRLDTQQRVAAEAGARAYPTTLFVNGSGQVVRAHVGEISRAALSAAIRDLERTDS